MYNPTEAVQVTIEEPLYFENFDLENVITPVKVDELEKFLLETNYSVEKTKFLINAFTNGFSIEYHGPTNVRRESSNLKFRGIGNKVTLWNKVMKEVKAPLRTLHLKIIYNHPLGWCLRIMVKM